MATANPFVLKEQRGKQVANLQVTSAAKEKKSAVNATVLVAISLKLSIFLKWRFDLHRIHYIFLADKNDKSTGKYEDP